MPKPSTPAVWASGKTFSFTPNAQQVAQGFDYIATIGRPEGAPITDDHDWPFNQITQALKWVMDQIPDAGLKSAAFMDVGTGPNQIPDMSAFQSGTGWRKTPDGYIEQWGLVEVSNFGQPVAAPGTGVMQCQGSYSLSFPRPFTTDVFSFTTSPVRSGSSLTWGAIGIYADTSLTGVNTSPVIMTSLTGGVSFRWRAIGK
ncbi:MAG: gp53-like domain-containing protein [Plesiomonas shigelloides]